jgi:hypothetical protein
MDGSGDSGAECRNPSTLLPDVTKVIRVLAGDKGTGLYFEGLAEIRHAGSGEKDAWTQRIRSPRVATATMRPGTTKDIRQAGAEYGNVGN